MARIKSEVQGNGVSFPNYKNDILNIFKIAVKKILKYKYLYYKKGKKGICTTFKFYFYNNFFVNSFTEINQLMSKNFIKPKKKKKPFPK